MTPPSVRKMRFNSIMTTIVAFLPTMALSKVVKSNSRTPATCTCVAYADEYAATGTANGISFKWCPSSSDTTDGSRRPSTYSSGIAGVYSCCEWTMLYSNVGHTCSFSTAMSCPYGNKGTKREGNVHYNICMTEKEKDVFFVGRLANYKYFNMDQAILNSLNIFDEHHVFG